MSHLAWECLGIQDQEELEDVAEERCVSYLGQFAARAQINS